MLTLYYSPSQQSKPPSAVHCHGGGLKRNEAQTIYDFTLHNQFVEKVYMQVLFRDGFADRFSQFQWLFLNLSYAFTIITIIISMYFW